MVDAVSASPRYHLPGQCTYLMVAQSQLPLLLRIALGGTGAASPGELHPPSSQEQLIDND